MVADTAEIEPAELEAGADPIYQQAYEVGMKAFRSVVSGGTAAKIAAARRALERAGFPPALIETLLGDPGAKKGEEAEEGPGRLF